jgi:hypothetical protein
MNTNNKELSFANTEQLYNAATNRGIQLNPELYDSVWENSTIKFTILGEKLNNLYLCLYEETGKTFVTRTSEITGIKVWTKIELETFIGTRLRYTKYRVLQENDNSYTTHIGWGNTSIVASNAEEVESIADAVIQYLQQQGPIVP